MTTRVSLERHEGRPAWSVRAGGTRVGVVYRDKREFRALREGSGNPMPNAFSTREAAAKALARQAGYKDLDERIDELDEAGRPAKPTGPPRR